MKRNAASQISPSQQEERGKELGRKGCTHSHPHSHRCIQRQDAIRKWNGIGVEMKRRRVTTLIKATELLELSLLVKIEPTIRVLVQR